MKLKYLALATFFITSTVFATCTQEEYAKKAQEFTKELTVLSASNPQKMSEISQKVAGVSQQMASGKVDMNTLCSTYDDLIKEMKK